MVVRNCKIEKPIDIIILSVRLMQTTTDYIFPLAIIILFNGFIKYTLKLKNILISFLTKKMYGRDG